LLHLFLETLDFHLELWEVTPIFVVFTDLVHLLVQESLGLLGNHIIGAKVLGNLVDHKSVFQLVDINWIWLWVLGLVPWVHDHFWLPLDPVHGAQLCFQLSFFVAVTVRREKSGISDVEIEEFLGSQFQLFVQLLQGIKSLRADSSMLWSFLGVINFFSLRWNILIDILNDLIVCFVNWIDFGQSSPCFWKTVVNCESQKGGEEEGGGEKPSLRHSGIFFAFFRVYCSFGFFVRINNVGCVQWIFDVRILLFTLRLWFCGLGTFGSFWFDLLIPRLWSRSGCAS